MSKIPIFNTLDKLVEFWEKHDFTDYWDELEEVGAEEAQPGSPHRISLELPLATLLEAIEHLPLEDARQIYDRLGERLGEA